MQKTSLRLLILLGTLGLARGDERIDTPVVSSSGDMYLRWVGDSPEGSSLRKMSVSLESGTEGNSDLLFPGERVLRVIHVTPTDETVRTGEGIPLEGQNEGELVIRNVLTEGQSPSEARLGVIRRGALISPEGEVLEAEAYVPSARGEGRNLVIPVPVSHDEREGAEYLLVDYSRSQQWGMEPALVEDPQDTEPLGDRQPVVLIHGLHTPDQSSQSHDPAKLEIWDGLREAEGYRGMFGRYKFYLFKYPTYRHVRDNGDSLVRLMKEEIGVTHLRAHPAVLIGHSMGGLVIRWAVNNDGFGDLVGRVITGATPHHGAGGASLVYANWRIMEKVGPFWAAVIRFAHCYEPDTPGLRSIAWDNFDGSIPPGEQSRYGLVVNDELLRLNEDDPYTGKLTTLMGDVSTLLRPDDLTHRLYDLIRHGQGVYAPAWSSSDPLVPRSSGVFEGDSRHEVITYQNFDHAEIVNLPEATTDILRMLRLEALEAD